MYKIYFSKILLVFSIFISCNNAPAENEANEWLGWFGEVDGNEAWLNIEMKNGELICTTKKSGDSKIFYPEISDRPDTILLNFPLHLEKGKSFIKRALKTENFYLFKVKKNAIEAFKSDYFLYVPIPQVGGAMKKMKPPEN